MMDENQKKQLKIAARYGRCDEKYLGEMIDQIRMAGISKSDLRYICHTITCGLQDAVTSVFRDFINDDQYQRFFACIQTEAKSDIYMSALEYAFRVYGSISGHIPMLNAEDQRANWDRIATAATDGSLTCEDMLELTEVFPGFLEIFQNAFETFVDQMDVWSPEDVQKTECIIQLLMADGVKTKNKKVLGMRMLREKNVTNQSSGAQRLCKYFSLRQIRYLNAKLADRIMLSDAILQKIDASFIRNLICSGDDAKAPYTEAEKTLLLETCEKELKPKIDGCSKMREYVRYIKTDRYEQPKLTEENWMFLYQKMVCETYHSGFMSFLGLLTFDCLEEENRNRWLAISESDRRELMQEAIAGQIYGKDEEKVLKKALDLIVWTMQQSGTEMDESAKLKGCIQYAGIYAPAFIRVGLVQYQTEAFEGFWNCCRSLTQMDNWTLRMLLRRYREMSRTMPETVFAKEASTFFEAISRQKDDPLTREERIGLFELYVDSVYEHQPMDLLKLYNYMLAYDIPFSDFMEPEVAKELAGLLLREDAFPQRKDALLKNFLSEQEYANHLAQKEEEKVAAQKLKELESLQESMEKTVMQLLTAPRSFLSNYQYRFCRGEEDLEILDILKNTSVKTKEGEQRMLDEILYQSMMASGKNIFEYADSMTNAAEGLKDPYFLQILAKRITETTDDEWKAMIDGDE